MELKGKNVIEFSGPVKVIISPDGNIAIETASMMKIHGVKIELYRGQADYPKTGFWFPKKGQ